MKDYSKYQGIIPAFYACYDARGDISPEGVRALAEHFLKKGVKGLYVGGSSGECIYHSVEERKCILENVMAVAKGKITIIAHVACNNTADSRALAAHAEAQGVDAIAAIPPIYFHLPSYAIAAYWNQISAAAPNTDYLQYPPAGWRGSYDPSPPGDAEESPGYWREELFHACAGYSDVPG